MSKNSQRKVMQLHVGDKVLCIGGMDEPFPDGDIVETGKVYTVKEFYGHELKLFEKGSHLTVWRAARFVKATPLLEELA